jgi:predicted outer membrane repeat protein
MHISKLSKLLDATCVFCFCVLFVVSKHAEMLHIVSLQATIAAFACAGNFADVDGGAVAMDGCQCSTGVTVHHSVNFTNNTAARQGGAVYVNGLFNMTVVFHTVRFHENTVSAICC